MSGSVQPSALARALALRDWSPWITGLVYALATLTLTLTTLVAVDQNLAAALDAPTLHKLKFAILATSIGAPLRDLATVGFWCVAVAVFSRLLQERLTLKDVVVANVSAEIVSIVVSAGFALVLLFIKLGPNYGPAPLSATADRPTMTLPSLLFILLSPANLAWVIYLARQLRTESNWSRESCWVTSITLLLLRASFTVFWVLVTRR